MAKPVKFVPAMLVFPATRWVFPTRALRSTARDPQQVLITNFDNGPRIISTGCAPTWLSFCLLIACLFGLVGCSGMQGMEMGSSRHTSLYKEVEAHDVTVILEVPPVIRGQEAVLAVRVRDNQSGEPIAGANVTFTILDSTESHERPSGGVLALPEIQAEEAPQTGLYRLRHAFQKAGPHEVTAKVRMRPKDEGSPAMIVTAIQEVAEPDESRKWLPVIGLAAIGMGLAMVVMMGAMIAAAATVL